MPTNKKLIIESKVPSRSKTGTTAASSDKTSGSKKCRSWLLIFTLLTLLLVVYGTINFASLLEYGLEPFTAYWSVCFIFAAIVLGLAVFDMKMVRRELQARQMELDAELAKIVSDAEKLANENSDSLL